MRLLGAFVGGLVVFVLEESIAIGDWITGRDRDAEWRAYQDEQHERLWNTRSDL